MKKIYLSIFGALFLASNIWAQPTNAPTAPPLRNAGDVISIYSEAYAPRVINIDPDWGPNSGATTITIAGNEVVEMANLTYQGLDFNEAINVSSMETVHIDLWSETTTSINFSLISQGPIEKFKTLTIAPGWNSYDIPLSFYATAPGTLVPLDNAIQFKFDGTVPATPTIYYDNIYFYKSASTPTITGFSIPEKLTTDADFDIIDPTSTSNGAFTYTSSNTSVATVSGNTIDIVGAGTTIITANQAASGGYNAGSATTTFVVNFPPPTTAPIAPPTRNAGDVISVYSEAYTNLPNINFNPPWGQQTQISEQTPAGNKVQRLLNFNYQGIDLAGSKDVSALDMVHIDIWTPDCSSIDIYLINPGSPEYYKTYPLTLGSWTSLDIPLLDFTSQGVTLNDVGLFKFVATGWEVTGTKTLYYDNLYFYKEVPLPVSLSDFNAKNNANEVALTWKTLSESNNKGFAIERSPNDTNWQQVGFVNGQNNSNSIFNYTFEDKNPFHGINYYRLVQEDNNGSQTISDIKSVNFNVSDPDKLKAYPNPATENLFAQLGQVNHNNATLSLVDLKGNVLKTVDVNQLNSNSTIQIAVESLPKGLYLLILNDGSNIVSSKIVVK
jgi:hypothetical protein